MIYLGNGLYSDSGPDTLAHYGVLGMKWGVRKARKVDRFGIKMDEYGNRSALKRLYKSGKISKQQLRTGLKVAKQTTKYNKKLTNQHYKNMKRSLKSDIRANPEKYKGLSAKSIRDTVIAENEARRPGFADMHKAWERYRRGSYAFGAAGGFATSPYKKTADYYDKNKAHYDSVASYMAQIENQDEKAKKIRS